VPGARGRACPLRRIEPEAHQAGDKAALAAAATGERGQLAGSGVAGDDQELGDTKRTAAEHPLEHAQQPAFVLGLGREAVREQAVHPAATAWRSVDAPAPSGGAGSAAGARWAEVT
jgi:hypothetical protein